MPTVLFFITIPALKDGPIENGNINLNSLLETVQNLLIFMNLKFKQPLNMPPVSRISKRERKDYSQLTFFICQSVGFYFD